MLLVYRIGLFWIYVFSTSWAVLPNCKSSSCGGAFALDADCMLPLNKIGGNNFRFPHGKRLPRQWSIPATLENFGQLAPLGHREHLKSLFSWIKAFRGNPVCYENLMVFKQ